MKKAALFVLWTLIAAMVAVAQPSGPIRPNYHWQFVDTDPNTAQGCTTTQEVQVWISLATGTLFTCQNGHIATLNTTGLPINNPGFTGTLSGLLATINTFTGSVNTQINVMAPPYNAKGDCVTDDQAAITAAQTAAITFAIGAQPPATLYFPKPPGGCYLTSTIQWLGVSMEGQPSGLASDQAGVEIRGKPGQDILHVQDPTLVNYTFYGNWSIHNITFNLDDSVLGSFAHRFPGRWFDDTSITSGSALLTTTRGVIDCGDVGQAIQVNGAGVAGANLVTTIASVSPCWANQGNWPVVTLAATASTSVSNAHTYISVMGLSVTTTVGNAAIAFDNQDGNTANWVNPSMKASNLYDKMDNVGFRSIAFTDRGRNATAAIWTQGVWGMYGFKGDHINFGRTVWGVVQACADINSYNQSCSNDFQKWDHMLLNGIANPWVSYNGGEGEMSGVELTTSSHMQFLSLGNAFADSVDHWTINIPEVEGGSTIYGLRLTGRGHFIRNTTLSNLTLVSHYGGNNSTCIGCSWRLLNVEGSNNKIDSEDDISTSTTHDYGRGNRITSSYISNPLKNMPLNQAYSPTPLKDSLGVAGMVSQDSLDDGNNSVLYNKDDLFILPKDITFDVSSGAYTTIVQDDAASPSGQFFTFPLSFTAGQFSQFIWGWKGNTNGQITVGSNLPIGKGTLYLNARCGSSTTFTFNTFITGGGYGSTPIPVGTATLSCSTSYQSYLIRYDVSAYVGGNVSFGNTTSPSAFVSYLYLKPDIATINNKPFAGDGAGITTGPSSGTVADHVATFNGTDGRIKDSGSALPLPVLTATTAALGGGALTAGQCTTVAVAVTSATTSMVANVSPVTDPGTGYSWNAWVSSAGNVTVRLCAFLAGTPTSSTYNVRVIQ